MFTWVTCQGQLDWPSIGPTPLNQKECQYQPPKHFQCCNPPFGFLVLEGPRMGRLQDLIVKPPNLIFLGVWTIGDPMIVVLLKEAVK